MEALRQASAIPGLAIAIVEEGQAPYVHGFGVRKMGKPAPVDADTIFPIGSTSKAFTVAALATLVDAGKISWDDRVIDRLPGFQMYDPYVTREITIRDLLVHDSGLGPGEGDLLLVPRSDLPRAEAVRRLRYLKPATSFRSGFAYENVLYMVAGQLIEAVTGQTWENYTREHVLVPVGMTTSTTDSKRRYENPNRAYPHARISGRIRGEGDQQSLDEHDELGQDAAPAGGLAVSANDLAKWLTLQLAHGKLPNGTRLFSKTAQDEMWKPVVVVPVELEPESLRGTQPIFDTYALGWFVRNYHSEKVVWHSGGVKGFQSLVVLLPEKGVAFAIEDNSEDFYVLDGLMFELLDHYLGLPRTDWPIRFHEAAIKSLDDALDATARRSTELEKIGPLVPLGQLAGTYTDPWYGDIVVAQDSTGLTINFKSTPCMSGSLEHWQFDSFLTRFTDPLIEPAIVTFEVNSDGHVSHIKMKPRSPAAEFQYDYNDLDFTPSRPK